MGGLTPKTPLAYASDRDTNKAKIRRRLRRSTETLSLIIDVGLFQEVLTA